MFKMPEPALVNEIHYSGIAVNKFVSENLYTEAQLKQVRREALEEAALVCDAQVNRANQRSEAAKTDAARDGWGLVAQVTHASRLEIRKLQEGL